MLACGGLLQILSLRGHALQLISVTDEAYGPDDLPQGRSVAQALENSDSLRRLGIPPLQMKWVRGRFMPNQLRPDSLLDFLLRYLRPGDVVFAPWRLDGDPDRETVGRGAHAACEMLGARLVEMPIQAGNGHPARMATCPGGVHASWYLIIRRWRASATPSNSRHPDRWTGLRTGRTSAGICNCITSCSFSDRALDAPAKERATPLDLRSFFRARLPLLESSWRS